MWGYVELLFIFGVVLFLYHFIGSLFAPKERRFPVETHRCIVTKDGGMIHDQSCRCGRNGQ